MVYVGTIHPHHHPLGIIFLNAKKNVLCEKPLAMNLREVKELVATAKTNNVFLMEVSRCTPCVLYTGFYCNVTRIFTCRHAG